MSKRPFSISSFALVAAFACGGSVRVGDGQGGAGGEGARGGRDDSPDAAATTGSGGYSAMGSGGRSTTGSGGKLPTPAGGAPAVEAGIPDAAPDGPAGICAGVSIGAGDIVTPNLLVLLDRSASMSCVTALPGAGDRWNAVKQAFQAFLPDASDRGQNIGVQYFGVDTADAGSSCDTKDYEAPDVEVAEAAKNLIPILQSFDSHHPGGDTPTVAALIGGYNHIVASRATLGGNVAVVLVTDGLPDDCGSVADAVNAATVGLQNGITTFVVGLTDPRIACDMDPNPATQDALDSIARAGGSRKAFTVDLTTGSVAQIRDALNAAQLTGDPTCHFSLPRGPNIDPTKLDVAYTPSGSMSSTTVYQVTGAAACDPKAGGWYYDDPMNPIAIDICPASCSDIGSQRASVQIDIGCVSDVRRWPAP